MSLTGNTDELLGYNTVIKNAEKINANTHKAVLPPFLTFHEWEKTPQWAILSSSNADTNTVDKLEDSGATFDADGVEVGYIVENVTDGTFAIVSVVTATALTLAADTQAGSSTTDIFPLGTEAYKVYLNPGLTDAYAEVNGQTISDADSPWNGKTLPDLNTGTYRMFRAATSSGGTGGADTHQLSIAELAAHTHTVPFGTSGGFTGNLFTNGETQINVGTVTSGSAGSNTAHNNLPAYYDVVMVMRIK